MRPRFCSYLIVLLLIFCGGYRSAALLINPTYTDAAGYTWTSERTEIIETALGNWEASVLDNQSFDVEFTFEAAGSEGYLGQWGGGYSLTAGTDVYPWTDGVEHTVKFNADLMDSISFDTADPPSSEYDALSITRHEIGHAMGFVNGFYVDSFSTAGETDKWSSLIDANFVFDPGGLDVQMEEDETHMADSEDLMATSIANGERKSIGQTNLDMLALAYGYEVIPEPSVLIMIALALPVLMYRKLKNGKRF